MREIPVFIPHGGGHLAAVVAVPRSDPTGLVLLLTGIGLPQVIGGNLWSRVASRLAEHGLASVRFDYEGIGESTGLVTRFSLSETESVVAQASTVLESTRRAVGVKQFALAGTCIGSRVTLELARMPDCVAAVCLAAPLINPGSWTRIRRRSQRWRLAAFIQSHRGLRRAVVAPLKRALGEKTPSSRLLESVTSAVGHARVLFLYSESPRDYYSERIKRLLEETTGLLDDEQRRRFEFRILHDGPLTAFDALSPEIQDIIVESVVEWVLPSFSRSPAHDGRRSRPVPA
jgi:pimeloyl-ACP methyl ester carboxylesterase